MNKQDEHVREGKTALSPSLYVTNSKQSGIILKGKKRPVPICPPNVDSSTST